MKIQSPVLKSILKRLSAVKAEQCQIDTAAGIASINDRDLTISVTHPALAATADHEKLQVTLNLRRFSAITSRMGGELTLTPTERSLKVASAKATADLEVFKGKPQPALSFTNETALPWAKLLPAFRFTALSAEAEIAAPFGGVVQLSTKQTADGSVYRIAATNGSSRLAIATLPAETTLDMMHVPLTVIRALNDLAAETVLFTSTESALLFRATEGDVTFTIQAPRLARTFPDYERILPASFEFEASVQPAEVQAALDIVAPMVGKEVSGVEDNGCVYLTFTGGKLTVSSLGQQNKAEDTVAYTGNDQPSPDDPFAPSRTHMLTHRILADFFSAVKEPVTIGANKREQPVVLTSGPFQQLIAATVLGGK